VDEEIERICRNAARDLRDAGAAPEEIEFNLADGRDAFLALARRSDGGNHSTGWSASASSATISPQHRAGLALTISEIAARSASGRDLAPLARAFRAVRRALTPTAPVPPFPVEKNYPEVVEGRRMRTTSTGSARRSWCRSRRCPRRACPRGSPLLGCRWGCRSSARGFRSR